MSKKKIIFIGLGCLVVIAAIILLVVLIKGWSGNGGFNAATSGNEGSPSVATQSTNGCPITKTSATVSGDSMVGIVNDGAAVTVLEGYYACNNVARGDVVVYDFPGKPLIKRVVGMPGDTFGFLAVASGSYLMINGKQALTAQNQSYLIPTIKIKMLNLYIAQDKGVIPAGNYLILGNVSGGTEDSIAFGLVSASDFTGKVQL